MNDEQTPALREAVENMANMREAYDNISQAAEAYNTGKTELAQNITAKGVEASATETLPQLAEKVSAIAQESYTIDGGEMYAKQLFGALDTPNYWNLYEVMEQLLSDPRLINYKGIVLAEYYKGYDSLALSGAGSGGAYVVSDLDANGEFKLYTTDITHYWDDDLNGKSNRWVAYCFATEGHDYEMTDTNTSPRSIFIGRKVGTIISLVNCRVSQVVVVDGASLSDFNTGNYTQNWSPKTIIRGIEELKSKIFHGATCDSVYVEAKSINATRCIAQNCTFGSLILKADESIRNSSWMLNDNWIQNLYLWAPVISLNGTSVWGRGIKTLILQTESCEFEFWIYSAETAIFLKYITNDRSKSVRIRRTGTNNDASKIELQNGWLKNVNISQFSNSLTAQSIAIYLLDRLGDNTGQDTLTLNLGATALSTIQNDATYSSYLADAIDNKNWNVIA